MMSMDVLNQNIEALRRARDEESARNATDTDGQRRFYHLVLLECAERLNPREFARCIEIAQEQMKKPL